MGGLDVVLYKTFIGRVSTLPVDALPGLGAPRLEEHFRELSGLETERDRLKLDLVQGLFEAIPVAADNRLRSRLLTLKRMVSTDTESLPDAALGEIAGQVAVPLEAALRGYADLLTKRARLLASLRDRHDERTRTVRDELRSALANPLVQEAVLLSSHELFEGIRRYLEDPASRETPPRKQHRKTERSALAILQRHVTKATPRAVLTAVHPGRLSPTDAPVQVRNVGGGRAVLRRKTALSLPVARELARVLTATGDAWRHVVPRVNPTVHRDPGRPGYNFWRLEKDEEVLCRLDSNEIMEHIVALLERRRWTAQEVILKTSRRFAGYGPEKIAPYFRKLVEAGLVLGHLEIPYFENDGLKFITDWIDTLPPGVLPAETVEKVRRTAELIRGLDVAP